LGEAHRGVRGFVFDDTGSPIEGASMKIKDREVGFRSTRHGEYWRILLPGKYTLEVYADNFEPKELPFVVTEERPTQMNVTLHKATKQKLNPAIRFESSSSAITFPAS